MAKPGARAARARAGQDTRARLVEAAIETLKAEGYAGTSARAIARAAGLNQALIFYYFGNLTGLLLAALDETSARRLTRYREARDGDRGPHPALDPGRRGGGGSGPSWVSAAGAVARPRRGLRHRGPLPRD